MTRTIDVNKRVRQVTITLDEERRTVRYNVRTGLLYRQNRSYDVPMCLEDFLDRLAKTKVMASRRGATLKHRPLLE